MNFIEANMADFAGAFLGFILTLFVFSYLWGENPFFRIATHLFVGVAAGYTLIIVIYNIILPQLILPLFRGNREEMILAAIYLIPCALILTKISPKLAKLGNPAVAILVGIGAAAAVGGAVLGTIIPQISTSTQLFEVSNFIDASVILIGTLSTLIYFQFRVQKDSSSLKWGRMVSNIGLVGQVFIAITFGALFAGVYFAALTALVERLSSLWDIIQSFLGIFISG